MLVGDKCVDDGGMRKRRRLPGSFLAEGAAPGVGGGSEVVADLTGSLNANEPLTALAGCDVDELVGGLSRGNLGKLTPALTGSKSFEEIGISRWRSDRRRGAILLLHIV